MEKHTGKDNRISLSDCLYWGVFSKTYPELARAKILATKRKKSEKRETAFKKPVSFSSQGAICHRT